MNEWCLEPNLQRIQMHIDPIFLMPVNDTSETVINHVLNPILDSFKWTTLLWWTCQLEYLSLHLDLNISVFHLIRKDGPLLWLLSWPSLGLGNSSSRTYSSELYEYMRMWVCLVVTRAHVGGITWFVPRILDIDFIIPYQNIMMIFFKHFSWLSRLA